MKRVRKRHTISMLKFKGDCSYLSKTSCNKNTCIIYTECKIYVRYALIRYDNISITLQRKTKDIISNALYRKVLTQDEINSILFDQLL